MANREKRINPIFIQREDKKVVALPSIKGASISTRDHVLAPYYYYRGNNHRLAFNMAAADGRRFDFTLAELAECIEGPVDYYGEHHLEWKHLSAKIRSFILNEGIN
jgi:hypothetical protein